MEPETESQQPTDLTRKDRTRRTLVATINLFLSVSLLLSLVAAWVFIPIANTPVVCVFHNKPWWISLVEVSAFLLIPASIVFGIVAVKLSKKEYRGLLRRPGILNIILGVLLTLSLVWAEFLYFVCQL
jgi:FtsH-binding integral membrane protein